MARRTRNQEVNINVLKIEAGAKPGIVHVDLKFTGNEKVYSYYRKWFIDEKTDTCYTVISGCKIKFTKDFQMIGIKRKYDVKGVNRKSSEGMIGKQNNNEEEEKVFQNPEEQENEEKEVVVSVPEVPEEKQEQEVVEEGEIRHEKYDDIKMMLECGIHLYLAGPAGSGKNFTVEQIVWDLGWNFYFSNSVQQEYKLDGFIDAGGKYHETEFYKACTDEHECIFFLDEMDASIPEVLINLNAAIANGYYNFPTGRVNLDHVHFVAAGNTVGSGADEMYSGRMVIDQATLDRFAIIDFDYSRRIEMSISHNNSDLVNFIHDLRKEAEENGIRATFSYRCITMVTKLEAAGMDLDKIIKYTVVKGMDKDTIKTLNPIGYTKYHQALRKVKAA